MAFSVLRLASWFTLLLGVVIAAIRLQPYDDSSIRIALMSSPDCALPCWQGIRPGVTTGQEALAILHDHPWVNTIQSRGDFEAGFPGTIIWTWNDTPPVVRQIFVTSGRLLIINNLVEYVRFPTSLHFGDIWMTFDHPDQGLFVGALNSAQTFHQASYAMLTVESTFNCPFNLETLWQTPVIVELRYGGSSLPLEDYAMAQWMRQPPC
jgi:hypothetical protein